MRWIDLEGAVNARDTGGLGTDDGGTTVTGRLLSLFTVLPFADIACIDSNRQLRRV